MLANGINPVVSSKIPTSQTAASTRLTTYSGTQPTLKNKTSTESAKKIVSNPAVELQLSDEGLHRYESDKAKQTLREVKAEIKNDNLSEIHSNLRLMRVNHLIYD